MNVRKIALIGGAFFAFTAASYFALRAQGPLYDKVMVDLPYTITVNNTTLQPGHYVIQQMPSTDISNRVLQIFSDDGTKFQTSVMTIPTVNNTTPSDTQVVLNHVGNDYYFDKIWIQGKDYGYEFVLPENVKSRAQESQVAVNVPATYQSAPAPEQGTESQSQTATANSNQSSAENQSAMNNPPSAGSQSAQTTSPEGQASTAEPTPSQSTVTAPNSQTPNTAEAQQQNPAVSSQSSSTQQSQQNPSLSAQATQQPAQPETTEQTAPQAQEQTPASPSQAEPNSTTPSQATAPSGEQTESRNRQMPQTAANWLTLLFSGAGLSGAGMMLRRWIR